jgi:hypothetical protein
MKDYMKKIYFIIFLLIFSLYQSIFPKHANAVENPLNVPNNKIGIHILFPHELEDAAKLVNSNGGDYGYVTVVIQSGDKDIEKWQKFMDDARRLHLIPIVRVATEGDPFNTSVWRKPNDNDIVDFANFLHSLNWPYKNRYIIFFNEVNRSDEWGGSVNPVEYAEILNYAVTVFKSKSPDYFIISAGLDNAAPNQPNKYMNQYIYMRQMNQAIPGIFNQIDGLSSHSYPNPGFSQNPRTNTPMSINSFQYERALVRSLSNKDIPVFITETGWSTEVINDQLAANYYTEALNNAWSDSSIVAITPFLLQGTGGPFQKFSLFGENKSLSRQYEAIRNYPKTKGLPKVQHVLSSTTVRPTTAPEERDFSNHKVTTKKTTISPLLTNMIKWLLKVQ